MKKTSHHLIIAIIFCAFSLFFLNSLSFALTPSNPYVKVQGRQLVTDFTGNGNYQPYLIRGVGYSPTPIGRYSSDWGYYISQADPNPNKLPNNFLSDPAILNRDFSLLKQMNANTVRIWSGSDNLECGVSAVTFENAFPTQAPTYGDNIFSWLQQNNDLDMNGLVIANLSSAAVLNAMQAQFIDPGEYGIILGILQKAQNADNPSSSCGRLPTMITSTTLTSANQYNLKVIAGFYVGAFGYLNCSSTPCTYNLNTYNADSSDPGLDAPFDITNAYIRNDLLTRFKNYVTSFKNRPEILFWVIGNENDLSLDPGNPTQIKAWYSLANQMAQAAHQIEGANYHPVAIDNGFSGVLQYIGDPNAGADDNSLSSVDIWGINAYPGQSFKDFFVKYKSLSAKPLWISEYGIDAWQSCDTTNSAQCDPNNPAGTQDQVDQAAWDGALWDEIAGNGDIAIGASVMEYSDEWWKPYDWICSNLPYIDETPYPADPGMADIYCHWNHLNFGFGPGSSWGSFYASTPDHYFNEEWWGLMSTSNAAPETQIDTMTPRAAYSALQGKFLNAINNAPLPSYMASPVNGTMLTSSNVTFTWSQGRGVTQYEIFAGTTPGAKDIYSNSGLTSNSVTVSGIPLSGKTIYVQLGSLINGAWQTSNYAYPVLSVQITASAGLGGTISPLGAVSVNVGSNQTFNIASSTGYVIGQVVVDGNPVVVPPASNNNFSYTFTDIVVSHTIAAVFKPNVLNVILDSNSFTYTAPASVYLSAFVSDTGGNVTKVEFYNGSSLISTSTTSIPAGAYKDFVYIWNNPNPGNYNVTAKAYDSNNNVMESTPAGFTINGLPTVTLTSTTSVATVPANISLNAVATEPFGTIREVAFYNGSTLLGLSTTPAAGGTGSPFSYVWTNVPVGNYNLTAEAFDNSNHVAISTPLSVTVKAAALPMVNLTSPANNSSWASGASITLSANASSTNGSISQVSFYSGTTLLGTASTPTSSGGSTYSFTWSNVPTGTYSLTAVATDISTAMATSSAVSITVYPSIAPTVILNANSFAYTAPASVYLSAFTSEPGGNVSKVEFYNGATLIGTTTVSTQEGPYSDFVFIWNNATPGNYSVTTKAYDTHNNATVSTPVSFNIHGLPTITFTTSSSSTTAPANITLKATATESFGTIRQVAFYNGPIFIGTSTTNPYSFTWTNAPAGNYNLTAYAFDNSNNVVASTPINMTVTSSIVIKSLSKRRI